MHVLIKLKDFILRTLEWVLVVTYIVFEQLIWETFVEPIARVIKQYTPLQKLALWINTQNSYLVLGIFVLLFAFVEALGIYAGITFFSGNIALALGIYAAKIPVATFSFWLFGATKAKLLHFKWFAYVYFKIMYLIDTIQELPVYIDAKVRIEHFKTYIRHLKSQQGGFLERLKQLYKKLLIKR